MRLDPLTREVSGTRTVPAVRWPRLVLGFVERTGNVRCAMPMEEFVFVSLSDALGLGSIVRDINVNNYYFTTIFVKRIVKSEYRIELLLC